MKKLIAALLFVALALTAAALTGGPVSAETAVTGLVGSQAVSESDPSTSDAEYSAGVARIQLGDTIDVRGEGATVEDNTLRITASGVYCIKGTLTNGRIEVEAEGKVYLEFEGVDVTSTSGPALEIIDAKKVTITLASNTTNSLTDTGVGDGDTAALLTNDTLVINGDGTLVVTGNNNEAISSDDDIIINSGTISVTAVDDGLNAHDDITINGGDVWVRAGGDGLDSNGTVTVNGGMLIAFGGTGDGDRGIDSVGEFTITGGTLVAGGSAAPTISEDSTQCSLYVSSTQVQPAGTAIHVSEAGEELLGFTPDCPYQNVLISMSSLVSGAFYQTRLGSGADTLIVAVR